MASNSSESSWVQICQKVVESFQIPYIIPLVLPTTDKRAMMNRMWKWVWYGMVWSCWRGRYTLFPALKWELEDVFLHNSGRWVPPQVAHLKVSTPLPMHLPSNLSKTLPKQTWKWKKNHPAEKKAIRVDVSGWELGKHLFSLLLPSHASFSALIHIGSFELQILHFWIRKERI